MMVELFVLGCTGVVVFLHGANFFFHVLSQHLAVRALSLDMFIMIFSMLYYELEVRSLSLTICMIFIYKIRYHNI
ncbi:hypothetical protein ACOSP7_011958 [Xanthoceras sorbifolium]